MGAHTDYQNGLLDRFADRKTLDRETLYNTYWAAEGLEPAAFYELVELIEEAYDIPAGLLRPTDPIAKLTGRVPERRWWRGPIHDVMAGDREFWLQEELDKRLKRSGLLQQVERINTVDDLVRCWCGLLPK